MSQLILLVDCVPFHTVLVSAVRHPSWSQVQESLVQGSERTGTVCNAKLADSCCWRGICGYSGKIYSYMWKYVLQSNFPLDSQSKLPLKLWLHGVWRRKLNSFPNPQLKQKSKFWWTGIIYLHIIIIIDRCTHFCCSSCRQSQASCYLYLHAELNWVCSSYIRKCYIVCISLYFMILMSFPAYEH